MRSKTAVLTMVRDDDFMLSRWVDYYGGLFGKDSLYVINHGNQPNVRDIAQGCNLFPVPDNERKKFTILNWRTKNHLLRALLEWYDTVIVCDVDEFIAVDPATGFDLRTWIDSDQRPTVRTPMGLEVVHLPGKEPESIDKAILGPRRFVKINLFYAKPCIISKPTKLSRGGHYSEHAALDMPDFLYLFHMKYCDYGLYTDTLNRRNDVVRSMMVDGKKETTTNVQWFAEDRDDDRTFADFEERKLHEGFDFADIRDKLHKSFGPRNHGLYHFKRPHRKKLYEIPERFFGLFGPAVETPEKSTG